MACKDKETFPSTGKIQLIESSGSVEKTKGNLDIIDDQGDEHSADIRGEKSKYCDDSSEGPKEQLKETDAIDETHTKSENTECTSEVPQEELREIVEAEEDGTYKSQETTFCETSKVIEDGAEALFCKPCEPCLDNKRDVESIMYCVECEEYLCEACVTMHRGVKLTKSHNLISKEIQDKNDEAVRLDKKEECPIHTNEYLDSFCTKDDKLCCKICKITEHGNCKSVVAIEHAVDTGKLHAVLHQITETQAKLKDAVDKKGLQISHITEDRNDSLRVLEGITNDTEKKFESLRNLLKRENRKIESKYSTEKERLKSDIENSSRIIDSLDKVTAVLQKESLCIEYRFIQMKKAKEMLKAVQRTISNSTVTPTCTSIGYERDQLFDEKLNAFDRFGYFDDEKRIYKVSDAEKIKITSGYEKKTSVFSICVVDCDNILVNDGRNSSVKLVDMNKGSVKCNQNLPGLPHGLCRIDESDIYAVTVTFMRRVTFIKVTRQVVTIDEKVSFETGENCRGIACMNSKLFVACGGIISRNEGPGHIRVFDMNGKLLDSVMSDINGTVVVSVPYNITLIPAETTAYITDFKSFLQIDISSNELKKVKNLRISPSYFTSMCFDPDGRAIVAEPRSKSITLFSSSLEPKETLISDLPNEPFAIAIDHSSLKVFVGLVKSHDLLCFKLKKIDWNKPPKC